MARKPETPEPPALTPATANTPGFEEFRAKVIAEGCPPGAAHDIAVTSLGVPGVEVDYSSILPFIPDVDALICGDEQTDTP